MKGSPAIETLHDDSRYDLIAAVEHHEIKDFVVKQVIGDQKLIPAFTIYQTLMLMAGLFFVTRAIMLAYKGNPAYLFVTLGTLLFCFTLLVVIHELLHGMALKISGAPNVRYGGIFRKFMFYAEADRFVLGRKSFLFVALTPLVIVQLVAAAGIIVWFSHPVVYFFLMLMSVHSFFCAGDVALATLFLRYPGREVFTYDSKEEKKSFYFVEKEVEKFS